MSEPKPQFKPKVEVVFDNKKAFAEQFQPDIQKMNESYLPATPLDDEPPEWFKNGENPWQEQRDGSNPDFEHMPDHLDPNRNKQLQAGMEALRDILDKSEDEDVALALDTLAALKGQSRWTKDLHERYLMLGNELLACGVQRELVDQLGLPVETHNLLRSVAKTRELGRRVSKLQPVVDDVVFNPDWMVMPYKAQLKVIKRAQEANALKKENARLQQRIKELEKKYEPKEETKELPHEVLELPLEEK